MGIGNLYDDDNGLGETREVQLAADLIHPSGGKGGDGGTLWTKTKEGSFTLESSRIQERFFFSLLPLCRHHNPHHHTAHFMTIS